MKKIKVHPIVSASVILWGDDGNEKDRLVKGKNCEGSVVFFNKRQFWNVVPYKRASGDLEYCGECEYKNFVVRLMPKDFLRIFGSDIVKKAGD